MAIKRVTMQDIAAACNLSRNTVSKVFNNRTVPESTRRLVLQKAQEMGYYPAPEESRPESPAPSLPVHRGTAPQTVVMLTSDMPTDYHFAMRFLPVFTERLSRAGYTLMMHEITPAELREKRLPAAMTLSQTAGILGTELFDRDYVKMLCSLDIPFLSVDGHPDATFSPMNCSYLLMENLGSSCYVTSQMIEDGAVRLGFVGDADHCISFRERWMGFTCAVEQAGMTVDRSLCILERDSSPYGSPEWLASQIRKMPERPDALLCANDFLAFNIMQALRLMGLSIPDDVRVAGFDSTPQSAMVDPPLTTVQIPNEDFGRMAADILLSLIQKPDIPCSLVYVKTTPVIRASTLSGKRAGQTAGKLPQF